LKIRLLPVLLVLTLMVGYYLLGTGYLKYQRVNDNLKNQTAAATRTLESMAVPAPDAKQRLAAAQVRLVAIESEFPQRVNSTLSIDSIFKLADAAGVKALPMITQPWSAVNIGSRTYYVLRLNVSAAGAFSDFMKFTASLENSEIGTLIIEQLTLNPDTKRPTGEQSSEASMPVSASIDLAVFSRLPPEE
jgi:hypothetical protein